MEPETAEEVWQPVLSDLMSRNGWMRDDLLDLEKDLRLPLMEAVDEARAIAGLRVRRRSGWRGDAQQKALRDAYEAHLAAVKAGTEHVPPLPAACAGHSAHNHTLCATDQAHTFGFGDVCDVCGGAGIPAAAACDVEIVDPATGHLIPSGGGVAVEHRPRQWQLWAQVLERHPKLRDGGTFHSPDPVHVEDVRWSDKDSALTGEFPPETVPAEAEAPAPAPAKPKKAPKTPKPET